MAKVLLISCRMIVINARRRLFHEDFLEHTTCVKTVSIVVSSVGINEVLFATLEHSLERFPFCSINTQTPRNSAAGRKKKKRKENKDQFNLIQFRSIQSIDGAEIY